MRAALTTFDLPFACQPCRARFATDSAKKLHDEVHHTGKKRGYVGSKRHGRVFGRDFEVPDLPEDHEPEPEEPALPSRRNFMALGAVFLSFFGLGCHPVKRRRQDKHDTRARSQLEFDRAYLEYLNAESTRPGRAVKRILANIYATGGLFLTLEGGGRIVASAVRMA